MIIVGIDPGKDGGYAEVSEDGRLRFTMPLENGLAYLAGLLSPNLAERYIWVEKAQVMAINGKKSSTTAMFTYGVGFGRIIGHLEALKIRHQLVRPADWTRLIHAGTADTDRYKGRSFEAARRIFPGEDWLMAGRRKPHDGICEAALIAEYGRRMLKGGYVTPEAEAPASLFDE